MSHRALARVASLAHLLAEHNARPRRARVHVHATIRVDAAVDRAELASEESAVGEFARGAHGAVRDDGCIDQSARYRIEIGSAMQEIELWRIVDDDGGGRAGAAGFRHGRRGSRWSVKVSSAAFMALFSFGQRVARSRQETRGGRGPILSTLR